MTDMQLLRLLIIISLVMATVNGCSRNVDGSWKAPLVHRIDIQQGNVIDQAMLNKLERGMAKDKVRFIMGTPMIRDPFHENRWDYVYSMEPGDGERSQRRVTLYFREDRLAYVDGDINANSNLQKEDNIVKERSVIVPLEEEKEGFFDRVLGGDDKKKTESALAEEPAETVTEDTDETPEQAPTDSIVTEKAESEDTVDTTTARADESEPEQDKNLFRRFWERMTSGADDSTIDEGIESERDRRDAEMLEKAGGEL